MLKKPINQTGQSCHCIPISGVHYMRFILYFTIANNSFWRWRIFQLHLHRKTFTHEPKLLSLGKKSGFSTKTFCFRKKKFFWNTLYLLFGKLSSLYLRWKIAPPIICKSEGPFLATYCFCSFSRLPDPKSFTVFLFVLLSFFTGCSRKIVKENKKGQIAGNCCKSEFLSPGVP